jgi:hypothetical protein
MYLSIRRLTDRPRTVCPSSWLASSAPHQSVAADHHDESVSLVWVIPCACGVSKYTMDIRLGFHL